MVKKRTKAKTIATPPSRRIAAILDPSRLEAWPEGCPIAAAVRFHISVLAVKEMFLGLGVPLGVDWMELVENVYADPGKVTRCARALTFNLVPAPVFPSSKNNTVLSKESVHKAVLELSNHFSNVKIKSVSNYEDKKEFREVVSFAPKKWPEDISDTDRQLLEFSDKLFEVELLWDASFVNCTPYSNMRVDPTTPNSPEELLKLGSEMGVAKAVKAWSLGVPLDDMLVGY